MINGKFFEQYRFSLRKNSAQVVINLGYRREVHEGWYGERTRWSWRQRGVETAGMTGDAPLCQQSGGLANLGVVTGQPRGSEDRGSRQREDQVQWFPERRRVRVSVR